MTRPPGSLWKLKKFLPVVGLAALFLFAGSGCAVGPDYKRPETKVPEAWSGQAVVTEAHPSKTTTDPASLQEWWNSFNDPTLTALVEMALRANLDLRQAEARIRQARASKGVAVGGLLPTVTTTTLYQKSQGSSEAAGGGAIATAGGIREIYQAGLDASWEIDIFGGKRRAVEAAGADLRAAVDDRRDVFITLVGDVGNNYLNLRGFQQQVVIARNNLAAQKKTADIIHRRFDAGFVSRLDVANADAQVATTAAVIPLLESSARAAIYSLGVLLGREPAALEKDLLKEGPIPPTPPEIPVGLPSDLLRRRPDIRRAEAQLHAATARIGVATADLFPKFNMAGSAGFAASDITILTTANTKFWSFGPTITWPIFQGGSIRWNIKLQEAIEEEKRAFYEKAVLTALKDVETALVAYAKEQDRRKALFEAVANNRKAVDVAMKLYVVGKTDFLNVLTAQRNLFTSEDAFTLSTRTVATNLIALYKALGGGWDTEPQKSEAKKAGGTAGVNQ